VKALIREIDVPGRIDASSARSMEIVIIIVALVGLLVAGVFYSSKKAKERTLALSSFAASKQFDFEVNRDATLPGRFSRFGVFNRGFSRYAYNTMRGTTDVSGNQVSLTTGDYSFKEQTGSGKDRKTTTYDLSYVIAELPFTTRVTMTLRNEGFFDKIAGAIGFDDIDFESAEFSKKFFVKCDDKKVAYDMIDPRMIQWLLETEVPTVEIVGDFVLIYGGLSRWKPEQFESRFTFFVDFISRWPGHLVNRLKSGGPA